VKRQDITLRRKTIDFLRPATSLVLLVFLFLGCPLLNAASDSPNPNTGAGVNAPTAEKQVDEAGEYGDVTKEGVASISTGTGEKPSDEYGNVTEEETGGEESRIADPIEPWNRAIYHVNDKLYFWLFKPAAKGYRYVVPEEVRGIFSNFYENLKAPIRIVNNFLQGKPQYAGFEFTRFLINSTVGVGGLRDCAKECFGINGRDADFGQTLGKYGVGFGFYIVWPILGPSSPRDTVGLVGDRMLTPTTYVSSGWMTPESTGLTIHEKINYTSFHIGDYEAIKGAAIDPYVAMRDAYIQYRKKALER
jgi:phospholipid-binding lipoprotein MlaA